MIEMLISAPAPAPETEPWKITALLRCTYCARVVYARHYCAAPPGSALLQIQLVRE